MTLSVVKIDWGEKSEVEYREQCEESGLYRPQYPEHKSDERGYHSTKGYTISLFQNAQVESEMHKLFWAL